MAVTCCITFLFSRLLSELTNDALEGQEVSLVRSCVSILDQVKSSIKPFFRLDSVLINNYLDCLDSTDSEAPPMISTHDIQSALYSIHFAPCMMDSQVMRYVP